MVVVVVGHRHQLPAVGVLLRDAPAAQPRHLPTLSLGGGGGGVVLLLAVLQQKPPRPRRVAAHARLAGSGRGFGGGVCVRRARRSDPCRTLGRAGVLRERLRDGDVGSNHRLPRVLDDSGWLLDECLGHAKLLLAEDAVVVAVGCLEG